MTLSEVYLRALQSKVFKLLPMREAKDQGIENHLDAYIDNLCASLDGASACYHDFPQVGEIAEVQSNLYALKMNPDLEFAKWRSTVLRSTRLLQTVLIRDYGEV